MARCGGRSGEGEVRKMDFDHPLAKLLEEVDHRGWLW